MPAQIDELIAKYRSYFPLDPVSLSDLNEVEQRLSVILPSDLRAVATVFGGNTLSLTPQLAIGMPDHPESITQRTLAGRREVNLPRQFVRLAEFDESVIIMETREQAEIKTPIYWIGRWEDGAIAQEGIPGNPDRVHESYADYFSMLLSEELRE